MMQTLRRNMRLILFIALAFFLLLIFFQWGLDIMGIRQEQKTEVAKVDGVPVLYTDYIKFAQQKEAENKGVSRDDVWAMMIEEVIWNTLIRQEKLVVTDEEILAIIRSNPPREVYESEYMKNEQGQFDFGKYYELLKAPQSRAWLLEYEFNLRKQLPKEKMQSLLSSFGWVSPFEDSMLLAGQMTTVDVTYLGIPFYRARGFVAMSDQDLDEYYRNHLEEFTRPELKILKYVYFEKSPSSYDTLEAKETIEDFMERMKEGEDFLEVARELSDDTLVVFSIEEHGASHPSLAVIHGNLKNGELSGLIKSPQGFEVIKRINKDTLYRMAARVNVSPTTLGELYDKIMSCKEAIQERGIDTTAGEFGIPVRTTYPLNSEEVSFPVRDRDGLAKFLKKAKIGDVGGPFGSMAGYYLFVLDSVIPAVQPTLQEIMPQIKAQVQKTKLRDAIERRLNDYYNRIMAGTTMEALASEDTLFMLEQRTGITLSQLRTAVGSEFAGVVANLDAGQVAPPLVTDWAGYIMRCDKKNVMPLDSTMLTMLQMKRQMRLQELTTDIFTPNKLQDNRDIFFE